MPHNESQVAHVQDPEVAELSNLLADWGATKGLEDIEHGVARMKIDNTNDCRSKAPSPVSGRPRLPSPINQAQAQRPQYGIQFSAVELSKAIRAKTKTKGTSRNVQPQTTNRTWQVRATLLLMMKSQLT